MKTNLGDTLSKYRERSWLLKQRCRHVAIAAGIRCAPETISRWVNGRSPISSTDLQKILAYLQKEVDESIRYEDIIGKSHRPQ